VWYARSGKEGKCVLIITPKQERGKSFHVGKVLVAGGEGRINQLVGDRDPRRGAHRSGNEVIRKNGGAGSGLLPRKRCLLHAAQGVQTGDGVDRAQRSVLTRRVEV